MNKGNKLEPNSKNGLKRVTSEYAQRLIWEMVPKREMIEVSGWYLTGGDTRGIYRFSRPVEYQRLELVGSTIIQKCFEFDDMVMDFNTPGWEFFVPNPTAIESLGFILMIRVPGGAMVKFNRTDIK